MLHGSARRQRQTQTKQSTARGMIFNGQRATVALDDAVADGQAQPGSTTDRFGRKERFEKLAQVGGGNPGSVIVKLDHGLAIQRSP